MRLYVENGTNYIKSLDDGSVMKLQVIDYDNSPVNLSTFTKVEVKIGNVTGVILNIEPSKITSDGVIEFNIPKETLPADSYQIEVHMIDSLEKTRIAPSDSTLQAVVTKSLDEMGSVVNVMGVSEILNKVSQSLIASTQAVSKVEESVINSKLAISNSDEAISIANRSIDDARESLTNSKIAIEKAEISEVNSKIAKDDSSEALSNSELALETSILSETNSNNALVKSNEALSNSESSLTIANASSEDSTLALFNSKEALEDSALALSNSKKALEDSTLALSKATISESNSGTAKSKAENAESNSNIALTKAENAENNSTEALSTINIANDNSKNALTKAENAENNSTEALRIANNSITDSKNALDNSKLALENSELALSKATISESNSANAKTKAENAETVAKQVRNEFDALTEGNTSAEVIGARTNADNVSFTTIKQRLDDSDEKVNNKVAKVEGKGLSSNDYTQVEKEKLSGVENKANNYVAPLASTTQKGDVQLNDTVTSTSTSLAATANAVKQAYDLANSKQSTLTTDQTRKITVSTSDPTGGANGDIWFKYE